MTIFLHEITYNKKRLILWTLTISSIFFICMMIYTQMNNNAEALGKLFADMGSFSSALGMDKLNFGKAIGFYGIVCSNILKIGGGIFASILGISALAREEKDKTCVFLLTHPVSRATIALNKLFAVIVQILILNVSAIIVSVVIFRVIGAKLPVLEFALLHFACFVLQIEIACICFGISSFLRRGNMVVGVCLTALLCIMNLAANISGKADGISYITPFAYAEASDIILSSSVDDTLIILGLMYSFIGVIAGTYIYCKKDIA